MATDRSMQVRLSLLVGDYVRNAQQASAATRSIGDAAEAPRSALDGLKTVGADLGRTMVTTAGVSAAAMAAWTANAFATGVAYNSLQQTAGSALETLMGSAAAATAQMEELTSFARTSPFPRQLWIQAQQTLIGFGVEAERIVPIFQALQDGVVAVGGSAQQIEEVVHILAQITTTGRVTGDELNELAYRGINAAELVGDAWGMSAAQLRDAVSQGTVDATSFIDALVEQMSTKYGGAAEGLRQTWVGALDRIAGATRDFGAVLAEPFVDPSGGGAAVDWANAVADAIRALEATARPAMELLSSRAQPALASAAEAAGKFAAALNEVDLIAIIDRVSEAAPALGAFAASAAAAGSASALSAIGMGGLASAISPVAAGVGTLAVLSPELRSALSDLLAALMPLIPPATDLAIELAALISSGAELAGSVLSVLAPALSGLVAAITPLVQFASGLAQILDAIPGPALAAAAGVLALTKVLVMLRSLSGSLAIGGALVGAFDKAEAGAKRAATAVGGFRNLLLGLGSAVVIGGITALIDGFSDTAEQLERVRSVSSAGLVEDLERLAATGESTGGLAQLFGDGADAAEGFARSLSIATATASSWSHWWNVSGNERDAAKESFRALDAALAETVRSGEDADAALRKLAAAYDLTDEQVKTLLEVLPQYTAEADRQAAAGRDAAAGADEYAEGLEALGDQAASTRMSLQDLTDQMQAQTDPVFAAIKATQDLAEAEANYSAAVQQHGASSEEARAAMLALLEAKSKAIGASSELAQVTGGELTPEMLALAESVGLTADDLLWLTGQVEDAADVSQDYADTIMDINGDITDSGGRMKVEMALVYSGMSESAAHWVVSTKRVIDDLMAAGWEYEDALAEVARRSGRSTASIEQGFEDARNAGLKFSDDYPAHISLTGTDEVLSAADIVQRRLDAISRTVTISFQYENFLPRGGARIPVSAEGRIARSPMLTWVAEAGHPESIISWDPKHRERSLSIWEETGRQIGAFSASTRFARPVMSTATPATASAGPEHFTADALIDLGGGITQVVEMHFRRHDRDLRRTTLQGTGAML